MRRSALRRWSVPVALLTAAAILLLTLTPLGTSARGCTFGLPCDAGHLGLFAVLGASLGGWYATSEGARRAPRRLLFAIIFGIWLFAALDEVAQGYVGRDPSAMDWAEDMVGALLGLFGGSLLLRLWTRG